MSNHQRQTSGKYRLVAYIISSWHMHMNDTPRLLRVTTERTKMSSCRRLSFHMRFAECTCSRRLQRFDIGRQFFQRPTVAHHVTPHAEPREPMITVIVDIVEQMRSENAAGFLL
jgi:hypothetical protein